MQNGTDYKLVVAVVVVVVAVVAVVVVVVVLAVAEVVVAAVSSRFRRRRSGCSDRSPHSIPTTLPQTSVKGIHERHLVSNGRNQPAKLFRGRLRAFLDVLKGLRALLRQRARPAWRRHLLALRAWRCLSGACLALARKGPACTHTGCCHSPRKNASKQAKNSPRHRRTSRGAKQKHLSQKEPDLPRPFAPSFSVVVCSLDQVQGKPESFAECALEEVRWGPDGAAWVAQHRFNIQGINSRESCSQACSLQRGKARRLRPRDINCSKSQRERCTERSSKEFRTPVTISAHTLLANLRRARKGAAAGPSGSCAALFWMTKHQVLLSSGQPLTAAKWPCQGHCGL